NKPIEALSIPPIGDIFKQKRRRSIDPILKLEAPILQTILPDYKKDKRINDLIVKVKLLEDRIKKLEKIING
ncbi:MAG: hypothetical protein JKY48_18135, partial [Flavobacteriales bacterium]|nr:hypothetical protein [Flavobacteriales bacterium]